MREGGPLNITCRFSGHRRPAQFIHWWRGTTLLNTAGRGGIAIHSDKVGICAAQFIHWWRGTTLLNTAARGGIAIHSDKVGICAAQIIHWHG
jgi:hypothetical protein